MKRKMIALSQAYEAALRWYLQQGPQANLQPALDLGRQAAALDLETLDVARIHEGALAKLEGSSGNNGFTKRAELFFSEVISPIEKTHKAALKAKVHLSKLKETLNRRTAELAASRRHLQQGIIERKAVQNSIKKSVAHFRKLLKESLQLQRRLQRLTHQILAAQEDKRKKTSRDLHDEIAQTLLGINIRLLTLKKEATINTLGLGKEIVSTQKLVDKSLKSIQRFAREFGNHPRTLT